MVCKTTSRGHSSQFLVSTTRKMTDNMAKNDLEDGASKEATVLYKKNKHTHTHTHTRARAHKHTHTHTHTHARTHAYIHMNTKKSILLRNMKALPIATPKNTLRPELLVLGPHTESLRRRICTGNLSDE